MDDKILVVDRVNKSFGGVTAIAGLSFGVIKGESLGFMGPNGAGKSTLINVISGDYSPDTGTIKFMGKDITGFHPHHVCSIGIGRTYQIPQPFVKLSVLYNIAASGMYGGRMSKNEAFKYAENVVELVGLGDKKNRLSGDLEEISLKRLELGRALATKPMLLLIDELAGGLTEKEIPTMLNLLREIRGMGITLILIEHVMKVMLNIVDRIIVLDGGIKIAEGRPEEIIENKKVIEAYFGTDDMEAC